MRYTILIAFTLFTTTVLSAQERMLVDKVIAKVGNETILLSDIEAQYSYATEQAGYADPKVKCAIMENIIGQKLIVHHAKLDSVEIAPEELESNLDFRIQQVLRQMNGDENFFEEYYGMTILQMRDNLRDDLKQQLLAERMQQTILNEVSITPKEVKEFYNSIPVDSLPYLNAEVELLEIVSQPQVNETERTKALKKILDIRERILSGESKFEDEARLYSDDPGSGSQGGNLGYVERGGFVPEFEAMAYSLDKRELSEPVETEFGFHILELLDRRGNKINLRHILVKPQLTEEDQIKAKVELDSLRSKLLRDEITFSSAVKKYSYEKVPSYNNNGIVQNPQTGKNTFETAELDFDVYLAIEDMEVGDITEPLDYPIPTGETYYRIVKLTSKSKPHRASLEEDYSKIQRYAKESKKSEYFNNWLDEKFKSTFILVEKGYIDCPDLDNMISG